MVQKWRSSHEECRGGDGLAGDGARRGKFESFDGTNHSELSNGGVGFVIPGYLPLKLLELMVASMRRHLLRGLKASIEFVKCDCH